MALAASTINSMAASTIISMAAAVVTKVLIIEAINSMVAKIKGAKSTIDSMSAAITAVAASITNSMESGASADNSVVAKGTVSDLM